MFGFRNLLSLGLWAWMVASLVIIFNLSKDCAILKSQLSSPTAFKVDRGVMSDDLHLVCASSPGEVLFLGQKRSVDGATRTMCAVKSDAAIEVFEVRDKSN